MLEYRRAGISEQVYRQHMLRTSIPMAKDLMIKQGIKQWTQVSRRLYDARANGRTLTADTDL